MNEQLEDPREIELKLEVEDPGQLAQILSHPALAQTSGATQDHQLRAIYFDTPDQALRAAGLSLRVRHDGGRWVQTLKAAGESPGVALDRSEWECEVEGPRPDFARLGGTPLAAFLPRQETIGPAFEVHVRRTSLELRMDESVLEVSADRGEVQTAAKPEPFGEIEIELKRGAVKDVFALASTLSDSVPLRLSLLTKSERGYLALQDASPERVKAEPVALSTAMSAAQAFQTIARACLRHFLANERVVARARNPEAVHQMRVALRRLRAAITLFKDVVRDEAVEAIKADLKWITGELGRARDLDVYIATVLEPARAKANGDPDLAKALAKARKDRNRAYAKLANALVSARFRRAVLATAAWVEAGPWLSADGEARERRDQPARDLARKQLKRRWRSVRRRLRNLREIDPEARHEVRIAIKKLRYGSEFFGSLFRQRGSKGRQRKALRIVEDLQETLGVLNDIAVGTARRDDSATSDALNEEQLARVDDLLSAAEAQARSLDKLEPFWKSR